MIPVPKAQPPMSKVGAAVRAGGKPAPVAAPTARTYRKGQGPGSAYQATKVGTPEAKAAQARAASTYAHGSPTPAPGTGGGNSEPMVTNTAVNPMQKHAYDAASSWEKGIADETNLETTRELSRFRDEVSRGVQAEGEEAMGRGADSAFFRSQALAGGSRDLSNLGAKLAGENLKAHQGAIDSLTDSAGSAADQQNRMNLGTMSANIDQQRVDLDAADQQHRYGREPYEDAMDMTRLLLANGYNLDGAGAAPAGAGTGIFGSLIAKPKPTPFSSMWGSGLGSSVGASSQAGNREGGYRSGSTGAFG